MKKVLPLLMVLILLAGLVIAGKLDFSKPTLVLPEFKSVGKDFSFILQAEDKNSPVVRVKVSIVQNGREVSILTKEGIKQSSVSINVSINPQKLGLIEGEATLKVEVSNSSWFRRVNLYERQVKIDLTPPVISVVDWTKNLINGGTGFAFFKTSEPLSDAYIKVGSYNFKCLELSYGYVCPFSFPYFENDYLPVSINVADYAKNRLIYSLSYNLKKINYSKSVLSIDDNFIQTKIKPLSDIDIKDNVELFKHVNVEIRKKNEDVIHRISSECKNKEPLFEGYFSYLENSAKLGGFADYRKYSYEGQIIEGADAYHKGFDFASVKNGIVKASNKGEVVFTGFLGIYGNTVIVDHGMCVYSLYSHLDQIDVKVGQKVNKNTIIGKTGTTGLAVGDHLHYGIIVNGIEVNPIEWFDPKWLDTRFFTPYKQLKGG